MLILDRNEQTLADWKFEVLPECVRPGDVIVVNNTRVFPARLIGHRDPSGARVEVLLIRELESDGSPKLRVRGITGSIWEALVRPAHRLRPGARIRFGHS